MAREIDASLSRYISLVQHFPQLTRERELQLVHDWQRTGSAKAADELVRAHLRHVVSIALKYRRYGLSLSELIAEGNFGVVHALRKFEPERGNRFVTYAAYWIRAYVLSHVIRSWSLVGVGSGALRSKMFFKLRRERVRLMNLLGDSEQVNELLARQFNVPTEQLTSMVQRLESRDVSLDAKVFDDAASSVLDTLVSPDPAQDLELAATERQGHLAHAVKTAVAQLDERERYIVEQRLMADDANELSLAEIGRRLGVSRERARQLETRAKRKLKDRISELARDSAGRLEIDTAA